MKFQNKNGTVVRTSNSHEMRAVQKLMDEGWQVYKRGWIRFIEVKPFKSKGLGKMQRKMSFELFRHFGIRVEFWEGGNPSERDKERG